MSDKTAKSLMKRKAVLTKCLSEVQRLESKLKEAISETDIEISCCKYPWYLMRSATLASAKRSALDVKRQLTELTRFTHSTNK